MIDLRSVIASFGALLTIERASEGAWIEGVFQPGEPTDVIVNVSVQPAGAATKPRPEGVRVEDLKVLFSQTLLRTAQDRTGFGPDRFTYAGQRFEVFHIDDWSVGGQGQYYRALAARIRNAEADEQ